MIEFIFTSIFIITVLILGLLTKKILYVNEHELAIENEMDAFDKNFKTITDINEISDFKLGTNHIYK